jgi:hypothetical protein
VSSTRRLLLRARMLVLLVGVTTALLLIRGTASSYLLAVANLLGNVRAQTPPATPVAVRLCAVP